MTETDSSITESYNEMGKGVETNTNNDDITRGYEREREGVGTIGLD